MWPFKKKKKDSISFPYTKKYLDSLPPGTFVKVDSLDIIPETTRKECPESQRLTQSCICINCPSKIRRTCTLEQTFSTGCESTFLTSCSNYKYLTSFTYRQGVIDYEKEEREQQFQFSTV